MRLLDEIPAEGGYCMPAEFSEHSGCVMIYPERSDSWSWGGYKARAAFCEIARAISESEQLTVFCSDKMYPTARRTLPENVRVAEASTDDCWARDVAPIFLTNAAKNSLRAVKFGFNAWGGLYDGLYFPWDKDDRFGYKAADMLNADVYDFSDFILEGGSVCTDGEGTLLTTESCLLSKGRNPELTKAEIEDVLRKTLGVSKIIWLPDGIYNDETNGHVDNVCCFARPAEVVLAWTDDENDPQYALSRACLDVLNGETDACGRKFTVHRLNCPDPIYIGQDDFDGLEYNGFKPSRTVGERLAASYVNFYMSNGAVIMPLFGDEADDGARALLQKLFPTRKVVGVYAREILVGGGNIHCLTQQIPRTDNTRGF